MICKLFSDYSGNNVYVCVHGGDDKVKCGRCQQLVNLGEGYMRIFLYFSCNFSVSFKLFQNHVFFKKLTFKLASKVKVFKLYQCS